MNREIKFRAWKKVTKEMFSGWTDIEVETLKQPTDTIVLMQFTGLHDKNGKEIYEGDIIHSKWKEDFVGQDDSINIVYWSNKLGAWGINEDGKDKKDIGNYYLKFHCHPKHIKIIGNIYENPELLQAIEKGREK